jgi:hypothetical protein
MRVIIAGPRLLHPSRAEVQAAVDASGFDVSLLIHGDAKGVDTAAKSWAIARELFHLPVLPRWEFWKLRGNYKYAGPERNGVMADIAEALIIIKQAGAWSSGTLSMYREAKARNLPTYIYEL